MASEYTEEFGQSNKIKVKIVYYKKCGDKFVLSKKNSNIYAKLPGGIVYHKDREEEYGEPINMDSVNGFVSPTVSAYKPPVDHIPIQGVPTESRSERRSQPQVGSVGVESNQRDATGFQSSSGEIDGNQASPHGYSTYKDPQYPVGGAAPQPYVPPAYRPGPAVGQHEKEQKKYEGPISDEQRFNRAADYRQQYLKKHKGILGYYVCIYCGKIISRTDMQVDHIMPVNATVHSTSARNYVRLRTLFRSHAVKAQGVNGTWNLGSACAKCNKEKSDKTGSWWVRGMVGRFIFPVIDGALILGLGYGGIMALWGTVMPLYFAGTAFLGAFLLRKLIFKS